MQYVAYIMLCTVYSFVDSDLGHWYCIVLYCGHRQVEKTTHLSHTRARHPNCMRHTMTTNVTLFVDILHPFVVVVCFSVAVSLFSLCFASHFSHFTFVCLTVAVCISFWSLCISL